MQNEDDDIKAIELVAAKYEDDDFRATELNQQLDYLLAEKHEKSARKYESYLINRPDFKTAIKKTRAKLLITNTEPKDEYAGEYGPIVIANAFYDLKKPIKNPQEMFDNSVTDILKQFELSENWRRYIEAFIVNGYAPKAELLVTLDKIRAQKVNSHGQITLVLKPGLRHEDYIKAWKGFEQYLGPSARLKKPFHDAENSLKLSDLKKSGKSYTELAKEVYPNMDIDMARDRVKKIIKRANQRSKSRDK